MIKAKYTHWNLIKWAGILGRNGFCTHHSCWPGCRSCLVLLIGWANVHMNEVLQTGKSHFPLALGKNTLSGSAELGGVSRGMVRHASGRGGFLWQIKGTDEAFPSESLGSGQYTLQLLCSLAWPMCKTLFSFPGLSLSGGEGTLDAVRRGGQEQKACDHGASWHSL